jgi:hypothetical protein
MTQDVIQFVVLYLLEIFGLALLEISHTKFNIDRHILTEKKFSIILTSRRSPLRLLLLDYSEYKTMKADWAGFGIRYSPALIVAIAYIGATAALFRANDFNLINAVSLFIITLTLFESLHYIRSTY